MADWSVALLVCHDLLPDELIHQVGQVGQDEDEDYRHRQVSGLYPCPRYDDLMVSWGLKNKSIECK